MDFDDIDELETPFSELVAQAREEILNGAPVAQQWSALVERHDFFKDMVKEAKASGQSMGPILVAASGVTRAVEHHAVDNHTTVTTCTVDEARVLASLADVYDGLFSASPIPSACAWSDAMTRIFSRPATSSSSMTNDCAAASPTDLGMALAHCVQQSPVPCLSTIAAVVLDASTMITAGDDDGSFTVDEFKSFLRRCLQLGRKCTRAEASATHFKEMLSTISNYLTHSTLEW